jgi:hypothetical protein
MAEVVLPRASIKRMLFGGAAHELTIGQRLDLPHGPDVIKGIPAFLRRLYIPLRAIALARGDTVVLEWLSRVDTALVEGVYEALGFLDVGDVESAIAEFNRHGDLRLASMGRNDDSATYTWTFVGGPELTVDSEWIRASMLMPNVSLHSAESGLLH